MTQITISGEIGWDVRASDVREALISANGDDVELVVNSPGGLVSDALEIYNLIRSYSGKTKAVLSGYAMSAASYIPLAADEVIAEDNAVYMIHNVQGVTWGDYNEILKYGEIVKRLSQLMAKAYIDFTGKKAEEIASLMDAETWYYGDEITKNGFAHSTRLGSNDDDQDVNDEQAMSTALAAATNRHKDLTAKMLARPEDVRRDMSAVNSILPTQSPIVNEGVPAAPKKPKKEAKMDEKALREKYPDIISGIEASARAAGAAEEINRVKSVLEVALPGHEDAVMQMALDGETTGGDAAKKVLAAEKVLREKAAADFAANAPDPAPTMAQPAANKNTLETQWDSDPKLREEFMGDFALFKASVSTDIQVTESRR